MTSSNVVISLQHVTKRVPTISWEIGKEFFGKYGSGQGHLSGQSKKIIREKIHAKHHSH
ncbi:MAG: hypothetical protein HQM11_00095 [SAR324 cluster bacterium]|nr:hypothetical protein [SAR324 cluster bacterium]